MGKIIYYWNPLIIAVRVVALFCRNWVPLAGGEGWKVYLAVDLGSLTFGDVFVMILIVIKVINRSAKLDVLWTVSGKTALAAHVVGDKKIWRNTCRGGGHVVRFQSVHVGS